MSFFMKVNNATGSAEDKNHQGWIKLESMDFGVHRNISIRPGMGQDRSSSMPGIGEFVVTKGMDMASPFLFEKSYLGTSLGQVIIHASSSADTSEYLEYQLQDVILGHYDVNGAVADEQDLLVETLHLNFTQIQMKYAPRNANHVLGNPIITGYNVMQAAQI